MQRYRLDIETGPSGYKYKYEYVPLCSRAAIQPGKHLRVEGRRRRRQQLGVRLQSGRVSAGGGVRHHRSRGGRQRQSGGLCAVPLDCRRNRIWHGLVHHGAAVRSLPEEADPDVQCVSQSGRDQRCGRAAVQLAADAAPPHQLRRLRCRAGQHGAESHRHRSAAHPESQFHSDQFAGLDHHVGEHNDAALSIVHEQQSDWSDGAADSDAATTLPDDRVYAADH